ncbi:peptidylprolyl isomerase [Pseudotenacibaculum sp. MALMAid0570]|uniref:peptidylprolyl isomerase n=1 Tax=Pseudotenacibaculum sp. MALMAid0570 TaxID=3143938 RepID=UPI0032DFC9E8
MKKQVLFFLILIVTVNVFGQKDDQTLVTINGEKVTVADFKKVYEKNLNAIDNEEGKDVSNNLELYISYKLKVNEAYKLKLDTLKSYKREIQTYRNQLTAPYLQDKEFLDELIKEAYYRTKNEIRASHILVRLPRSYKPEDTLKAYNTIIEARKRILNGEPFEKVAKEISDDKSALTNGGDLGYFYAFRMIYDFEDVAYNTKLGEISMPFKTQYGYHIVKKTETRLSKGEREVAHILINDTTSVGKKKIDEVYSKLKEGKSFKDLAKEYSDDRNSKNKGGVLSKFGTGRMVKPFDEASFGLAKVNDFSKPFKTRFGWHIVKLIKEYPILSYEEMEKEIRDKVKRNGRVKLSDRAVVNRLRSEYKIVEVEEAKNILNRKDIRLMPKDSLQETILKINEKSIKQEEFVSYTMNRRHLSLQALFENFIDQEVLTYFKDNLKNTNPEFASVLKEYEDGLLLFELMERKIWKKSNDTIALKEYFDKNKEKYEAKDLTKVKGKVMNDYQNFLEKEWIDKLRSESTVKIHKKVLKKLIKYYRKES